MRADDAVTGRTQLREGRGIVAEGREALNLCLVNGLNLPNDGRLGDVPMGGHEAGDGDSQEDADDRENDE